jgi:hypothetical protein
VWVFSRSFTERTDFEAEGAVGSPKNAITICQEMVENVARACRAPIFLTKIVYDLWIQGILQLAVAISI